jgi:hypothetical protein
MKRDKILGMLGLATKAGKLVSGEFSVEKKIKSKLAKLVIVAKDSSENTKKLFSDKCEFYKIPLYFYSDKESLGAAIGKGERASVAVMDVNFSDAIIKLIKEIYEIDREIKT